MLLVTAALLAFAYYAKPRQKAQLSYRDAFLIGVAQAVAALPGLSRSGSTIATGLLLGNRKQTVAQFSFLMVLAPILGETFLELMKGQPRRAGDRLGAAGGRFRRGLRRGVSGLQVHDRDRQTRQTRLVRALLRGGGYGVDPLPMCCKTMESTDLQRVNFEEGYVAVIDKPLPLEFDRRGAQGEVRVAQGGLPQDQGRPCRYARPAGHGSSAGLHRTGDQAGRRLAGRAEGVHSRRAAGCHDPSFDREHTVDRTFPTDHITRPEVERALASLVGERLQTPPLYSAKKIEGTRAYEFARAGEQVEMRQSLVTIYDIELLECRLPELTIRVRCSKGTYIRSLAREIGEALSSGAYLTSLRRTRSGTHDVEAAWQLDDFLKKLRGE